MGAALVNRDETGLVSLLTVLAILVVACLAASCKPSDDGPVAAEAPRLSIGAQDNAVSALVLIADEQGYFQEEGVAVSVTRYPSGKLALAGMFEGEVDMATCADMPIASRAFERDDFIVLASIAETWRGAWVTARRDHGIETAEDLRGKRVGTQKSSAVHFFLHMLLLHNRIPESDVDIVFMDAVDLPGALVAGEIDAFSMRNPFSSEAMDELGDRGVELYADDVYRQFFNLVTLRSSVEGSSRSIQGVLRALSRAEEMVRLNPQDAERALGRALGPGREHEATVDWERYGFRLSLDQSLILTLEEEARWIAKRRSAKGDIPNFLSVTYWRELELVKPTAVTIIH